MLFSNPYYNNIGGFGNTANISQFGELITTERTPIIELNSSYGTSILRDHEVTVGSGNISLSNGELILSTGTTASSETALKSAEVGRYIPGYGAEIGIGTRFPTAPTGNQSAIWGGLTEDGDNGFYFGYDSSGVYVARRRNGTELNKTYQSNWNVDTLNGKCKKFI